jgi:hypothetical protein
MADTTNQCDGCRRDRGALALVPTRRGTKIGNTTCDGRRLLLCDECIVDRLVVT